jgi:hypothetical protein
MILGMMRANPGKTGANTRKIPMNNHSLGIGSPLFAGNHPTLIVED